jgi:nicotinamide mononucleotide transporter
LLEVYNGDKNMLTELLDKTLGILIYLFTSLEGWLFNFSLIYIILSIKKNRYSWLFAIISSILYGIVCIDYKMYPTAGLQLFFIVSSIYGFKEWGKSANISNINKLSNSQQELPVKNDNNASWDYTKLSKNAWFLFIGLTFLLAGIISATLILFTKTHAGLALYIESFAVAGSLTAQYLLAKKCIHNWYFWFLVNVSYVFVNMYQSLNFMAVLYVIFVILSIQGYFSWKNKNKKEFNQQQVQNVDNNNSISTQNIQKNEKLVHIKQMV